MSEITINDVEDAWLGSELFEEWAEEYEEKFYKPINDIAMTQLAMNISDAEMEQLKSFAPDVYADLLDIQERIREEEGVFDANS